MISEELIHCAKHDSVGWSSSWTTLTCHLSHFCSDPSIFNCLPLHVTATWTQATAVRQSLGPWESIECPVTCHPTVVLRHSALTCYPAFHNFRPAVLQNLLYFFYPSIWNMEYVEHFSVSYCSFKKRFNSTTAILTRGEPIRLGMTQYLVEYCI